MTGARRCTEKVLFLPQFHNVPSGMPDDSVQVIEHVSPGNPKQSTASDTLQCNTVSGLFAGHSPSHQAFWLTLRNVVVRSAWVGDRIILFKERV